MMSKTIHGASFGKIAIFLMLTSIGLYGHYSGWAPLDALAGLYVKGLEGAGPGSARTGHKADRENGKTFLNRTQIWRTCSKSKNC